MTDSVLVIIRSSGERTEKFCFQSIIEQVPSKNVHIIKERPFSEAVKRTFQMGADSSCKWTLAVDADIVLSTDAVTKMISKAETLEDYFFLYQGYVLDKLYDGFRGGGPHLYRSALLKQAIEFIPADKENLRPESATYKQMEKIGWHSYHDSEIYGIHDFEQSYFDYYRKGFLHAKKHHNLMHRFLGVWSKNMDKDEDIKMVLKGFVDGLMEKEEAMVDISYFEEKFSDKLLRNEKDELVKFEFILPDRLIANYEQKEPWAEMIKYKSELVNRTDKPRKISIISRIFWKFGQAFNFFGEKCFHISRKVIKVR